MRQNDTSKALLILFTVSGLTGLIYESIWTHYVKLFLGHAAYAQALVLGIFMGGLALGSWLCSRFSPKWKNPLLWYGISEGVIGIFALIFHPVFVSVTNFSYDSIFPLARNDIVLTIYKWALAAGLILPQTILLGMTFPLLSAGLLRLQPSEPGRTVARLYFFNSIGASFGVLLSGFILIKTVGLPGTIVIAGLTNMLIAVSVYQINKTAGIPQREYLIPKNASFLGGVTADSLISILIVAALVTGTASFIYEITWIRMLNLVLGTSIHSFELMLSAFILGLALGGLWIQRRIDAISNPMRFLALVQIVMGFCALLTLPVYNVTFSLMHEILTLLPRTDTGYLLFNLSSSAISMLVMLPTTFCAGMTLPLITAIMIRSSKGEGSVGVVYAANTIGAIVGVFFAIHIGLSFFQLKGLLIFGASMDMVLGLFLIRMSPSALDSRLLIKKAGLFILTGTTLIALFINFDKDLLASGIYREGKLSAPGELNVLFHRDGKTATVSITDNPNRTIRTNGKPDAAISLLEDHPTMDEATMVLAAAIPLSMHPNAKTVGVIGFGSGLTTHTFLSHPHLQRVDTVEIERQMVDGARLFGRRVERAYTDPRSRIVYDDAKSFFSSGNRKYDIIISEPSNPWVSGVSGLFSYEFYQRIRRHLKQDGLFAQWVQLYEIDVQLVVSILKAIDASFADYYIFATNKADTLIVATMTDRMPDLTDTIFRFPLLNEELRLINVTSLDDIYYRIIGSRTLFRPLFDIFPIQANSDYSPILEQHAARAFFLKSDARAIHWPGIEPLPVMEMLKVAPPPSRSTAVTQSALHPRAISIRSAMATRDFLMHNHEHLNSSEVSDKYRNNAEAAYQVLIQCKSPKNVNQKDMLFGFGAGLFPYISPTETNMLWSRFDTSGCVPKLPHLEREILTLFRAIGSRDGKEMASCSERLLSYAQNMSNDQLRYVLVSGMLGYLSQNRLDSSRALQEKYRSVLPQQYYSDILVDILTRLSSGHPISNESNRTSSR